MSKLEQGLQKRETQANSNKPKSMAEWVKHYEPQYRMALGGDKQKAIRAVRVIQSAISANPALLDCNLNSILGAGLRAVQLDLEVNVMGQCYMIPYNSKKGKFCQLVLGYRGLQQLFFRSKLAKSLDYGPICSNDDLSYSRGSNAHFDLVEDFRDRGEVIGYFACGSLTTGGFAFELIPYDQMVKHRNIYAKKGKYDTAWDTNFHEMAFKTVLKKVLKKLPLELFVTRDIDKDGEIASYDPTSKTKNKDIDSLHPDFEVSDVEPKAEQEVVEVTTEASGTDLPFTELLDLINDTIKSKTLKPAPKAKYESQIEILAQSGTPEQAVKLLEEIRGL